MRRMGIIAAVLAALTLAGCVAHQSASSESEYVMAEPSMEVAPEAAPMPLPKPITRPKRRPDCLSGEGDGIGGTGCAIKIH